MDHGKLTIVFLDFNRICGSPCRAAVFADRHVYFAAAAVCPHKEKHIAVIQLDRLRFRKHTAAVHRRTVIPFDSLR